MPTIADPNLRQRNSVRRPKVGPVPRRKPAEFPGAAPGKTAGGAEVLSASCSSASVFSEVSNNSSVGFGNQNARTRSVRRKRKIDGIEILDVGTEAGDGRRITRSYFKQRKNLKLTGIQQAEVRRDELSETSCVESFSRPGVGKFSKRRANSVGEFKLELKSRKIPRFGEQFEEHSASEVVASFHLKEKSTSGVEFSETSCLESVSETKTAPNADTVAGRTESNFAESAPVKSSEHEFECDSDLACSEKPQLLNSSVKSPEVRDTSRLESVSEAAPKIEIATTKAESNFAGSAAGKNSEHDLHYDSDLACSEKLTPGDELEFSTSEGLTLSELESELFPGNSYGDTDISEFTTQSPPSSAAEFSEKSDRSSVPSACFQLFMHYMQQFVRISSTSEIGVEDEFSRGFTLLRLEEEEHEESYQRFRRREKRQIPYDYDGSSIGGVAEKYGEMVVQQRLLMVNWMVEHSEGSKLQPETLFLGVSLLDRFLGRGFFKSTRDIEILGIACCTLASRIEENQPYNCVRQKEFNVGSNAYTRSEVVAMEWMVQEILKFQCFLPTTYNFLWFYLKAARADEEIESRAKYLAVLSLLDYERLSFWPSTVAAGLVILASLAVNRESSCNRVMETHVRTKTDDLPECIQSLEWLVKYVY